MEIKNLTCINCPVGCSLKVEMDGSHVTCVSGNTCRRGEVYARKEVTNPTRIVTTTVKVVNGTSGTVSVKTKEKIFACIEALKGIEITAPVHIGDVILKNVAETGVDIVATRNVEC